MTETNLATLERELHELKIRGVEVSPALVVPQDAPIDEVIRSMQDKRCGCAVVVDGAQVIGTFTERHVLACVNSGAAPSARVGEHANRGVPVLGQEDTIQQAIRLMHEHGLRHLPVRDGDRVTGVLSVRNVIDLLAEYFPAEVLNLPPRLRQRMEKPEGA